MCKRQFFLGKKTTLYTNKLCSMLRYKILCNNLLLPFYLYQKVISIIKSLRVKFLIFSAATIKKNILNVIINYFYKYQAINSKYIKISLSYKRTKLAMPVLIQNLPEIKNTLIKQIIIKKYPNLVVIIEDLENLLETNKACIAAKSR